MYYNKELINSLYVSVETFVLVLVLKYFQKLFLSTFSLLELVLKNFCEYLYFI